MAEVEITATSLQDYAALQAYTGTETSVRITKPGIAGFFDRDDSDTTTADDEGTVIVDGAERRWKRSYTGPVDVMWFGAAGDGITDDTARIQKALNVIDSLPSSACKTLSLSGRRFKVDKRLELFSGTSIEGHNATLDFSARVVDRVRNYSLFGQAGTGPETAIMADLLRGGYDYTFPVGLDLVRGDMIKVYSNKYFEIRTGPKDPNTGISTTGAMYGELQIIRDYDTVTGKATFSTPLAYDYLVSDVASFIKYEPLKDIKISGVNFKGFSTQSSASQAWCLSLFGAISPIITNCTFEDTSYAEVLLIDCFQAIVSNCIFRNTDQENALGYGISFANASRDCLAEGNQFFDKRHAYSTNNLGDFGTPEKTVGVVYGCTGRNSKVHRGTFFDLTEDSPGDAIDTHAAADYITYDGIEVYGAVGAACNLEGANMVVRNCQFYDVGGRGIAHINYSAEKGSLTVENVKMHRVKMSAVYVTKNTHSLLGGWDQVTIDGLDLREVGGQQISGERSDNAIYIGIAQARVADKTHMPHVLISNCVISARYGALNLGANPNGASISNCKFTGNGEEHSGVAFMARSSNVNMCNVSIEAKSGTGLYTPSLYDSIFSNVRIMGPGSVGNGWFVGAFSDVTPQNVSFSNFRISGFNTPILLNNACTGFMIRNGNVKGNTSGISLGTGADNSAMDILS